MNKQDLLQTICKTGIPEYSASFWLNVPEFLSKAEDKMNSGEEITLEYVADLMNEVYSEYFLRSFKEDNLAFDFPKAKEYLLKTRAKVNTIDAQQTGSRPKPLETMYYVLKANKLDYLYPALKIEGVKSGTITMIGSVPEYAAVLSANNERHTLESVYQILNKALAKMIQLRVRLGSAGQIVKELKYVIIGRSRTKVELSPTAKIVAHYDSFDSHRYSNPWITKIDLDTLEPVWDKIGGYTGEYSKGEAGQLFVSNPQEGAVYMYGQKDYQTKSTERRYVLYTNGEFVSIEDSNLKTILINPSVKNHSE